MPSDHDTELGTIFREMRRAMGVSRERIAGRLATPVETIDILESGDLLALPEWSEVTRVVTAYAAQLGLDSRPILRRMQAQISALKPAGAAKAGGSETAAVAPATVQPTPTPPEASSKLGTGLPQPGVPDVDAESPGPAADLPAVDADFLPEPSLADPQTAALEKPAPGMNFKARVTGILRSAGGWLLLIGLVGMLGYGLWFAAQNPRAVWSTIDSLPDPLPSAMRGAWELVRPFDEPTLRPQVSDPDNRKSDKLP